MWTASAALCCCSKRNFADERWPENQYHQGSAEMKQDPSHLDLERLLTLTVRLAVAPCHTLVHAVDRLGVML